MSHYNRSARSRSLSVASGFAALVLALTACGEEGSAEKVVVEATSAVGSVAAEATSAVGDATADDDKGGTGTATGEQPAPEGDGESANPDEEFLNDIRRVGVDAQDEQEYLTRGRDACTSLDEGMGFIDVTQQYGDAHPDAPGTEAPVVVTAAVKALCSQHLPQIGPDDQGN